MKTLTFLILFLFLAASVLAEGFYTDYPKWREHKGWRNELKTMDYKDLSQLDDALQHHMKINESTYSEKGKRKAKEELNLIRELMKIAKRPSIRWLDDKSFLQIIDHYMEYFQFGFRDDGVVVWRDKK